MLRPLGLQSGGEVQVRGVSARPLGSALTSLALALALAVGVPAPSALAESTSPTPAVALQKAAAPRLVSASATKLALDWDDVSGAQGYRVRYSRFSSMKSATSQLVTDSAATISGLKRSTRYYLRVQAVFTDAANTAVSPASLTVSFKTLALGAPTGLRAKASVRNANTVALNWSFSTPGRHYLVQYAPSPDFANATSSAARVASAAIGGLVTGQLYYFRVRIVNAVGSPTSGWSSAVTATPQTPADPEARSLEVATLNIRNWKRSKGGSWKLRARWSLRPS